MSAPIARNEWPQLLALLDQALDVAAAQRTAWVRHQGLSTAMQHTLARLLRQRRLLEAQRFMTALPAVAVRPDTPANPHRSGDLFGPWRVLRPLGQGGMSVVWLAQHAHTQGHSLVALKLPRPGPGQDILARWLLHERRILATLEHANIACMQDGGITATGTPYLVVEYVQGSDLLAHADEHAMTERQRVQLFFQALAAVQHVHDRHVLHRDLKPANMLVNAQGQLKLLDFGIASVLSHQGNSQDGAEWTQACGRQFTRAYASPEQVLGEDLSVASDVYSLGLVLHELLWGRVTAVACERPCPAVTKTRRLRPGGLGAVVLKALAPLPQRRHPSAAAFAADLRGWLDGHPWASRPLVAAEDRRTSLRRH